MSANFDLKALDLVVETAAGTGDDSFKNGSAKEAKFDGPRSLATGLDGEIYVTESYNHCIRVIRDGVVSTFAGAKDAGYKDGPISKALFKSPAGLCVGPDGAIYVADSLNHVIRKIFDGEVSTIAGECGNEGDKDGDAEHARFHTPTSVSLGPDGVLYVCDMRNHKVRSIKAGVVATVAGGENRGNVDGPAASARLEHPQLLMVDSSGSVYFTEATGTRLRIIKDGAVSTVAGTGSFGFADGPAASAKFERIEGLAIDSVGRIFISDSGNNRIRILENGNVSTFAGSGVSGFANGGCRNARFTSPHGLCIDDQGALYIADTEDHRVRLIRNAAVMTAAAKASFDLGISMASGVPKCGVTKEIELGGTKFWIHPSFVDVRCPKLIKFASSAKDITIDEEASRLFVNFTYSNKLPERCEPHEWMCLAYLLEQMRFPKQAATALTEFEQSVEELGRKISVDTLVKLYKCALDLDDYGPGINSCLSLMRTHKLALAPKIKRVAELLSKNMDAFYDLVRFLIEDADLPKVHKVISTYEEAPSIQVALEKLRNSISGTDFEIAIGSTDVIKCHSFVLYARWPYFRHMLDSGMMEASTKRLQLPDHEQDGGMHPTCLEAILDVAYLGKLQEATKREFDTNLALFLLSINELYLDGAPISSSKQQLAAKAPLNTFAALTEFAQALIVDEVDTDSVGETCETLRQIGLESLAEKVQAKASKK